MNEHTDTAWAPDVLGRLRPAVLALRLTAVPSRCPWGLTALPPTQNHLIPTDRRPVPRMCPRGARLCSPSAAAGARAPDTWTACWAPLQRPVRRDRGSRRVLLCSNSEGLQPPPPCAVLRGDADASGLSGSFPGGPGPPQLDVPKAQKWESRPRDQNRLRVSVSMCGSRGRAGIGVIISRGKERTLLCGPRSAEPQHQTSGRRHGSRGSHRRVCTLRNLPLEKEPQRAAPEPLSRPPLPPVGQQPGDKGSWNSGHGVPLSGIWEGLGCPWGFSGSLLHAEPTAGADLEDHCPSSIPAV